jgi:hypothetical protein
MANAQCSLGNVTNLGGHYTWEIGLGGMNLSSSHEFFFNIFVEGETSPRAITHNFNLTQAVTSTTAPGQTTIFVTSTSTASSTVSTTSSPTHPATSAASATNTVVPSNSGLSTGAKAGIGVGVAVGVIALLAAAAFWWRSQRGKGGAGGAAGAESGQATGPPYQPVNQQPPYEYYKAPGASDALSEVPANVAASELSGSGPAALEMADTSRPYH